MLGELLCDVSLQDESSQENKITRGTKPWQPQKRADGLRSYLEPSQSVHAHFVSAPETFVKMDSPECALRACRDGQLCVCSESCTDGQTTASRERAKALLVQESCGHFATVKPEAIQLFLGAAAYPTSWFSGEFPLFWMRTSYFTGILFKINCRALTKTIMVIFERGSRKYY